MNVNHNSSYRWVSQAKQFPGQQHEYNCDPIQAVTVQAPDSEVARSGLSSIKTALMQLFSRSNISQDNVI